MKLHNKKYVKGFTLIELLVVITIIGILATGAVGIYTSQIKKARDSTRMTDIKAVETAVLQFYQDKSVYPQGTTDWTGTGSSVTEYIQRLPQDPKNNETCLGSRCGYVYKVGDDKNGIIKGAYELSIAFEDQGNVDKNAKNDIDGGDDDARYEIGININKNVNSGLDTTSPQATAFALDSAGPTTNPLIIIRGYIATK